MRLKTSFVSIVPIFCFLGIVYSQDSKTEVLCQGLFRVFDNLSMVGIIYIMPATMKNLSTDEIQEARKLEEQEWWTDKR